MPRNIIAYPLKANGSEWNNLELKHSLRSLEQHWKGEGDVVLLSATRPSFIDPDKMEFHLTPGYMEAMHKAIKIADGGNILWMNDDLMFLKDTDWADLVSPVRRLSRISESRARRYLSSDNEWRVRLGKVMLKLIENGRDTWKFSTHTPYWYEADKLAEALRLYACGYKTPIECAYYNHYRFEHAKIQDKWRSYKSRAMQQQILHYRFMNLTDGGLNRWVKGFVRGRFATPSSFEQPEPTVAPIKFFCPKTKHRKGRRKRKK